jgi:hypothetical protein
MRARAAAVSGFPRCVDGSNLNRNLSGFTPFGVTNLPQLMRDIGPHVARVPGAPSDDAFIGSTVHHRMRT